MWSRSGALSARRSFRRWHRWRGEYYQCRLWRRRPPSRSDMPVSSRSSCTPSWCYVRCSTRRERSRALEFPPSSMDSINRRMPERTRSRRKPFVPEPCGLLLPSCARVVWRGLWPTELSPAANVSGLRYFLFQCWFHVIALEVSN